MKILNSREQKVSILVANYNNSTYLNRCIKSIQNQNYKNIDLRSPEKYYIEKY